MRIIITGANGFIGSSFQNLFKKYKYDLTIISTKPPLFDGIKRFKSLREINYENLEFDALIHCAASTPLNSSIEDVLKINRLIDKEFCNFVEKVPIKHVFYLSSMAVYGKIEVDKVDEYQVINNPNNYGISKLLGEEDLINCSKFLDNRISIIRLPGVVGRNMPSTFFRKLYESILNQKEVKIRSISAEFNNAILVKDLFFTIINLFKKQKEKKIIVNHHAKNIMKMGNLLDFFSVTIGKDCIYKESNECNPPFIITNKNNSDLLIQTTIEDMIKHFHASYFA